MQTATIGLICGGAGVAIWGWGWWHLWRRTPALSFIPRVSWGTRLRNGLLSSVQQRWAYRVRQELAVLGWTPGTVALWTVFFAAFAGIPTLMVTHHVLWGLVAAGGGAWFGPQLWIHRHFIGWQQELLRDFVPLTLLLSVYFDLGFSPETALTETLAALGEVTATQVRRLLAQWQQQDGTPADAVQHWAMRLHLLPYQQLADVLANNLDRGLSGAALKPLQTLVSAQQQQGARALADRVDQQITVVPALAMLGLMLVGLYAFFAHGLAGHAGITVL